MKDIIGNKSTILWAALPVGLIIAAVVMPYGPDEQGECLTCHKEILEGSFLHRPAEARECEHCHREGESITQGNTPAVENATRRIFPRIS